MTSEIEDAVARLEKDLVDTCPPGSRFACALVGKKDLRAILSALTASQAEVERLTRERDEARTASREVPEPTPEWENKARAFRAQIRAENPVEPEETLNMLRTWTANCQPANEHGQVSFARAMLESAEDALAALLSSAEAAEARATRAEALLEEAGEVFDNISFFAQDSLTNGHLVGGDVGNLMSIRDAARAFLDKLKGEG